MVKNPEVSDLFPLIFRRNAKGLEVVEIKRLIFVRLDEPNRLVDE